MHAMNAPDVCQHNHTYWHIGNFLHSYVGRLVQLLRLPTTLVLECNTLDQHPLALLVRHLLKC